MLGRLRPCTARFVDRSPPGALSRPAAGWAAFDPGHTRQILLVDHQLVAAESASLAIASPR